MKKFAFIVTVMATIMSCPAFAQTSTGRAAKSGQSAAGEGFAWGPAVAGIAVLAAVAAGTAAISGSSPSTHSH